MASSKRITIEVIGRDVEYAGMGGGTSKQTTDKNGMTNVTALMSPTETDEKEILKKNIIVQHAINDIGQMISNGVTYSLTRRLTLSEDYISQQDTNNAIYGISKLASAVTSVVAGAKIGGVAGAIVGGVVWVGTEIFNEVKRFDQSYIQLNEASEESIFQRTRLGLIDNGRGTQN